MCILSIQCTSIEYIYNRSTLSGFISDMVLILYKGLCKKINTDRPPFSRSCQVCLSTSCLQSKSNEKKGEGDRMIFQELEILHFKTCHIEKYDLEILEPPLSNTGVSDCCLTPTLFFNFSTTVYYSENKLIFNEMILRSAFY